MPDIHKFETLINATDVERSEKIAEQINIFCQRRFKACALVGMTLEGKIITVGGGELHEILNLLMHSLIETEEMAKNPMLSEG